MQDKRLRVDARKWLLSKLAPKKYGDKLGIGGAPELGPVEHSTRELTNMERAVRFAHILRENPDAASALVAALTTGAKATK